MKQPGQEQQLSKLALHRLQKELASWQRNPPPGMILKHPGEQLGTWEVTLVGAPGTLYEGEQYRLRIEFPSQYPMESPSVIFLDPPAHPHIYSNGHICLDILYSSWSPALTVNAVCMSILSMLSSTTEKVHPRDDERYVKKCKGRSPKDTQWWFHDTTC